MKYRQGGVRMTLTSIATLALSASVACIGTAGAGFGSLLVSISQA
jgi:hypothetical protein